MLFLNPWLLLALTGAAIALVLMVAAYARYTRADIPAL